MSENLKIYTQLKEVPKEAQKEILGGRLKGFTDINPMWRIKKLTEVFGICGFGWKYEILSERIEEGTNGEKAAFVKINLYVKQNGEWSKAIPGTGGSSFVAKESAGLKQSDECFKMALTDAISVAGKALGLGADIYFAKDRTKYDCEKESEQKQKPEQKQNPLDKEKEMRLFIAGKLKDEFNIPRTKKLTEIDAEVKKLFLERLHELIGESDLTKLKGEDLITAFNKIKGE